LEDTQTMLSSETLTSAADLAPSDATVSLLLAACDEELAIARAIGRSTDVHRERWGNQHEQVLDSAYSRPGFACTGRRILAVIVGDGVHAPGASTDVRLRYDGWATVAELAGLTDVAASLRRYVDEHDGADGMLVSEAITYLEGVRRLLAAA
jgi:hypothetical protein